MQNKSVKLNAVLNIVLTLSNIIFPLVTFPYVSRVLNPEGIGVTSFFSSIGNYGVLVASLGISTYGIREVANTREDKGKLSKVVQELSLINIVMSILVAGVLLVISIGVKQLNTEFFLLMITALTILSSPFALNWLYSGIEEYGYITKRSISFKFLSLILIFLFVKKSDDYVVYAGIILFSTLSSNILNLWHSRNYVSFELRNDLEFKRHLKPMWYLFASLLAVNIYTNLDTVMLGFINGNEAVGLYSIASKIKWILLSLITSISAVLLPRLSFYISKNDKSRFNGMIRESSAVIFFIAVPLVLFFIVETENSIRLLGGSQYLPASLSMQILMPILLISGFSNIMGNQILIPMNREKYFMYAVSLGALVNLILNSVLMPGFGIVGASVATLLAEMTQMFVQFHYSKRYLQGNLSKKNFKNVVEASILAIMTLLLFHHLIELSNPFLSLLSAGIVFGSVYVGVLVLLKEEVIIRLLQFTKII